VIAMQPSGRRQVRPRPEPVLPHIGVYVRVSSGEQARTGYSLEFQEERCLEWCRFRYGPNGYTHKAYRDEGCSGTLGLRPAGARGGQYRDGLTQMVRDIEAGQLDTVVFLRLDRLSRSPRLTHALLEDVFKKHDVGITSITEGFDASSKEGRMLVGILASVAAYYLDCMAESITEGLRTRKAKGRYSTTPPYGWRWKEAVGPDGQVQRGDAIGVVPEEARWVKQMAEWLLAGWGTPRIARELNRLGVKTHNSKQWGARLGRRGIGSAVRRALAGAGIRAADRAHAPGRQAGGLPGTFCRPTRPAQPDRDDLAGDQRQGRHHRLARRPGPPHRRLPAPIESMDPSVLDPSRGLLSEQGIT
jgi:DNA invertase Pin-like site-specific DNA recombinase